MNHSIEKSGFIVTPNLNTFYNNFAFASIVMFDISIAPKIKGNIPEC